MQLLPIFWCATFTVYFEGALIMRFGTPFVKRTTQRTRWPHLLLITLMEFRLIFFFCLYPFRTLLFLIFWIVFADDCMNQPSYQKGKKDLPSHLHFHLLSLIRDYHQNLYRQELLYHQKSRALWLQEGNANIRFFHRSIIL